MTDSRTEARHELAAGLEQRSDVALLALMLEGQQKALAAAGDAIPALSEAAGLVSRALKSGHRVVYCGAGSSGLIALTDAVELPGTFGIDPAQIAVCVAGGTADVQLLDSAAEDDSLAGRADVVSTGIGASDCLIAVSAGGSTPYTLAALICAVECGAATIAICCNADAPMFAFATVAIMLPTPPELVAGSTRMGAATAQKAALNMISTLAAIRLGHSLDGQMINLRIDNAKLRQRAIGVVATVGQCSAAEAETCLARAGDSIPVAILLARGVVSSAAAADLLQTVGNDLRRALDSMPTGL